MYTDWKGRNKTLSTDDIIVCVANLKKLTTATKKKLLKLVSDCRKVAG